MARRSIERHTDPYNPAPKAFQVNLPHERQGGFRGGSPWGRPLNSGYGQAVFNIEIPRLGVQFNALYQRCQDMAQGFRVSTLDIREPGPSPINFNIIPNKDS
jgi:hypothetical protein